MQQSKKRRVFLVAGNQVVSEGAVLLRNIVLARLLGAEEMGIVVMLAMMLRLLERSRRSGA